MAVFQNNGKSQIIRHSRLVHYHHLRQPQPYVYHPIPSPGVCHRHLGNPDTEAHHLCLQLPLRPHRKHLSSQSRHRQQQIDLSQDC